MAKKGKFDYILLETTGLADPGGLLISLFVYLYCFAGPIASMFWIDEELCCDLFLDGACCVRLVVFSSLCTRVLIHCSIYLFRSQRSSKHGASLQASSR
jgi:hypothetical protein